MKKVKASAFGRFLVFGAATLLFPGLLFCPEVQPVLKTPLLGTALIGALIAFAVLCCSISLNAWQQWRQCTR